LQLNRRLVFNTTNIGSVEFKSYVECIHETVSRNKDHLVSVLLPPDLNTGAVVEGLLDCQHLENLSCDAIELVEVKGFEHRCTSLKTVKICTTGQRTSGWNALASRLLSNLTSLTINSDETDMLPETYAIFDAIARMSCLSELVELNIHGGAHTSVMDWSPDAPSWLLPKLVSAKLSAIDDFRWPTIHAPSLKVCRITCEPWDGFKLLARSPSMVEFCIDVNERDFSPGDYHRISLFCLMMESIGDGPANHNLTQLVVQPVHMHQSAPMHTWCNPRVLLAIAQRWPLVTRVGLSYVHPTVITSLVLLDLFRIWTNLVYFRLICDGIIDEDLAVIGVDGIEGVDDADEVRQWVRSLPPVHEPYPSSIESEEKGETRVACHLPSLRYLSLDTDFLANPCLLSNLTCTSLETLQMKSKTMYPNSVFSSYPKLHTMIIDISETECVPPLTADDAIPSLTRLIVIDSDSDSDSPNKDLSPLIARFPKITELYIHDASILRGDYSMTSRFNSMSKYRELLPYLTDLRLFKYSGQGDPAGPITQASDIMNMVLGYPKLVTCAIYGVWKACFPLLMTGEKTKHIKWLCCPYSQCDFGADMSADVHRSKHNAPQFALDATETTGIHGSCSFDTDLIKWVDTGSAPRNIEDSFSFITASALYTQQLSADSEEKDESTDE
jgi:hypothetical protein